MAVRTKEELLNIIKEHLGDDTSDSALQLVEDISDTYDDLNSHTDGEDWKTRYEQNDADWRKKYRDRFFNAGNTEGDVTDVPEKGEPAEETEPTTFDELFKKE